MNVTDLITDRMHENLNPRDINEFEKYRWLVEMIAAEYAKEQVKNCSIPIVSQQRELLIATIEKVRYNLDGYGALTSSEIAERLEKALNQNK